MKTLECLPSSQYKYVLQSILPNHPRCNYFVSYNLKENPNRLVGSTRSSIEILYSIKTITRLESEILQIRSLLRALEAGSVFVCNTQHMMAEPLALPFPKDPSTTSPIACRLCVYFVCEIAPRTNLGIVAYTGTIPSIEPSDSNKRR